MTHLRLHETPKLGVHQTGSSSLTGKCSKERLAPTRRQQTPLRCQALIVFATQSTSRCPKRPPGGPFRHLQQKGRHFCRPNLWRDVVERGSVSRAVAAKFVADAASDHADISAGVGRYRGDRCKSRGREHGVIARSEYV